ncbi:hypothetical protein [Runella sp.]|uniref:hypothetical protein n=1 Tax=Runella sp. TaxID=1960881 RepID=UPI003D0CA0CF
MKHLLKPLLYLLVLLSMNLSCNKKEPCDDGICCGPSPQNLVLIKSLDNSKADVGNSGLVIEGVGYARFCILQEKQENLVNLKPTYADGQPQPFKYRVWGKVFECVNCPTVIVGKVLYVQIGKIEMVN